ncbi:MAG TPA: hypothetical protein P5120_04635 [Spirochaetota bacterium]|nr:hypothetical protein [Spirochaetota bacterium]HPF05906.1 hypothetical protein [Spirochaetota bacterium]HPJ42427.1 hypothetical protein [Spirochaetota bacterium]HPR37594.1 hypothetical protein [Spirochaetota bacterium]HRX46784.1 hypothetical protein [Spirochaetota bacterium]
MKKFILLLTVSIFLSGCISMPGQVDEKYLVEKNENESALIKEIEQKIIEKNKEKQVVEKKLKEISPASGQTEDELKLLKKENGLLKDQVDFYTKTKDAVMLESKQNELKNNEIAIKKKTAQLNYQLAEKEMTEAELEVKTNELSVEIARLNFEKSKIATAYRDKHEPATPEKSGNFFTNFIKKFKKNDPDDKYGYKKYDEYFKKQQEVHAKSAGKLKEAETKFQDAKAKYQESNK